MSKIDFYGDSSGFMAACGNMFNMLLAVCIPSLLFTSWLK